MALTKGWLFLPYVDGVGGGSEMQFPVKDFQVDEKDKGVLITDYPNYGTYGFSTEILKRTIKIRRVMISSKADFDLFLSTLKTLQSTAYNMRYMTKSTGEWWKFDGTNQTCPVLVVDKKGLKKSTYGDDQHYECSMLLLKQAGALTT